MAGAPIRRTNLLKIAQSNPAGEPSVQKVSRTRISCLRQRCVGGEHSSVFQDAFHSSRMYLIHHDGYHGRTQSRRLMQRNGNDVTLGIGIHETSNDR